MTLADHGAVFCCRITNPYGGELGDAATLTVQADLTPAALVSVVNLGDNTLVSVLYSEPVEQASATNPRNYVINQGVTVSSAAFGGDSRTIVLHTSPLSPGALAVGR